MDGKLNILNYEDEFSFDIYTYRDIWYSTSKDFDKKQTLKNKSSERFNNYKKQPLKFSFPKNFNGSLLSSNRNKINAAVLREKGSNSEREMAFMMSAAGFNVKDIHMFLDPLRDGLVHLFLIRLLKKHSKISLIEMTLYPLEYAMVVNYLLNLG